MRRWTLTMILAAALAFSGCSSDESGAPTTAIGEAHGPTAPPREREVAADFTVAQSLLQFENVTGDALYVQVQQDVPDTVSQITSIWLTVRFETSVNDNVDIMMASSEMSWYLIEVPLAGGGSNKVANITWRFPRNVSTKTNTYWAMPTGFSEEYGQIADIYTLSQVVISGQGYSVESETEDAVLQ